MADSTCSKRTSGTPPAESRALKRNSNGWVFWNQHVEAYATLMSASRTPNLSSER